MRFLKIFFQVGDGERAKLYNLPANAFDEGVGRVRAEGGETCC